MKKAITTLWILCILSVASAQQRYFQQEVNFDIDVTLDDRRHTLTGEAEIEYRNHSPDTLDKMYFHLWGNAYKNRETAYSNQELRSGSTSFYFAEESKMGGYEAIDFQKDGTSLRWEFDPEHVDIAIIRLPQPLLPGQKTTFHVPFKLKIPDSFSRLGHVSESYQMTQWYPKPAVYDHMGWHPMPYLDQGEFYSEFGVFHVRITLPENYVVAATGNLLTESEEVFLSEKIEQTEELAKTGFGKDNSFPPSSPKMKTLQYTTKGTQVHDFAWFADKRFHVLKEEVLLPSGKTVDCLAFFTDEEAALWKKAAAYVKRAVQFYSTLVGEYPYPHATAVQSALSAGGGMEYPMITVIGKSGNARMLDRVITHEVGHNWFYGILASNERDYPWMDEGVNSYYEQRYMEQYYQLDDEFDIPHFFKGDTKTTLLESAYQYQARRNLDQAPASHSDDFTGINYGLDVYIKTGRAFRYLERYLGQEKFDNLMRAYFDTWKFRHPYPEDLRSHLEDGTNEHLGWLFDDLLFSNRKMDYGIVSAMPEEEHTRLVIRNKGTIRAPFTLSGLKNGQVLATQWFDGFDGRQELLLEGLFDKVILDMDHSTFDLYRQDNQIRTNGLCRKFEPLQFKFFGGLDNPQRSRINWLPVLSWNNYDKTSFGLAFYSMPVPARRFEYALAPMYAFGSKSMTGFGMFRYQVFPESRLFGRIAVELHYKSFHLNHHPQNQAFDRFHKIAPSLVLDFKKSKPISPVSRQLSYRFVHISYDYGAGGDDRDRYIQSVAFNDLRYRYRNDFILSPFAVTAQVQQGEGFVKAFAHYQQKVKYRLKGKALYLHAFAGWQDQDRPKAQVDFLTSGRVGAAKAQRDYLLDETLLGRNERSGIFSQQIFMRDARLKTIGSTLGSESWMLGFGIRSGVPLPLPLEPYADLAIWPDPLDDGVQLTFSAGVAVPVVREVFEVYFPVLESRDLMDSAAYLSRKKYTQRISFLLNINRLNPWKFLNEPLRL